jgi:hypothetical protein
MCAHGKPHFLSGRSSSSESPQLRWCSSWPTPYNLTRHTTYPRAPWPGAPHNSHVTAQVQVILADAAEHVRQSRNQRSDHLEMAFAYATGVVAGLHDAQLITSEEHGEWLSRMHQAAGHEGGSEAPAEQGSGSSSLVLAPAPVVRRFLVGPLETKPFHDGEAAVPLVEVCDDRLIVWWRVAPLPTAAGVFGDDLPQVERDLAGVDEAWWRIQPSYHLRLRHLATVSITDEQGTSYQWRRGGSQGGPDSGEYTGYTQFAPAPPKSSRELTVAIGSADFRFRL